jgi:hypothetical protein
VQFAARLGDVPARAQDDLAVAGPEPDLAFGDVLAAPFGCAEDGHRRLRAVIGHATSFWTWRSLCFDHGLPDTEAVDAMTGMVLALTPVPQADPAK